MIKKTTLIAVIVGLTAWGLAQTPAVGGMLQFLASVTGSGQQRNALADRALTTPSLIEVKQKNHGKKKQGHDKHLYKKIVKLGGGPPPWAPAHGYRAKQGQAYVPPYGIDIGQCNRDLLGSVLGGVVGAAAGSTIGKGDGRTMAIVGGTIIGVVVGGSIGRSMDQLDQSCVGQVLEHAPDGRHVDWRPADSDSRYRVTPVQTYEDPEGRSRNGFARPPAAVLS
jgi:surface antigen